MTKLKLERLDLEKMSLDNLWTFYEKIDAALSSRIASEKQLLERRLALLNGRKRLDDSVLRKLNAGETGHDNPRRRYPKVVPKYQNPAVPSETWSGRGKRPRWLVSAMKTGKAIEDFKI